MANIRGWGFNGGCGRISDVNMGVTSGRSVEMKLLDWAKARPVGASILLFVVIPMLLTIFNFSAYYLNKALKPTDASNPNFNPQHFQFEDYFYADELYQTLITMFPEGTDKEYIDSILIESAQAEAKDYKDFVRYIHDAKNLFPITGHCPAGGVWILKMTYNSNNKLEEIKFRGPC